MVRIWLRDVGIFIWCGIMLGGMGFIVIVLMIIFGFLAFKQWCIARSVVGQRCRIESCLIYRYTLGLRFCCRSPMERPVGHSVTIPGQWLSEVWGPKLWVRAALLIFCMVCVESDALEKAGVKCSV